MKNYTFIFWIDNKMAHITVKEESKWKAEKLVRQIVNGFYLDDGLLFEKEEETEEW